MASAPSTLLGWLRAVCVAQTQRKTFLKLSYWGGREERAAARAVLVPRVGWCRGCPSLGFLAPGVAAGALGTVVQPLSPSYSSGPLVTYVMGLERFSLIYEVDVEGY